MKYIYVLLAIFLVGCSTQTPPVQQFAGTQPIMDLGLLTNGALAWGVVENKQGEMLRRLTAEISATQWQGGELRVQENVVFDDGEQVQRNWIWRKAGPGRLLGTANGVYGEVEALYSGSVLKKIFDADAKMPDGSIRKVTFEDVFYRIDETTLICRSFMSLNGIPIGEASVTIQLNG